MAVPNRRLVVAGRPDGRAYEDIIRVDEQPLREPGPGEISVRLTWLVVDPATRAFLNEAPLYGATTPVGGVVPGFGRGVVEHSQADGFTAGDVVQGRFGWRERAVVATASRSPVAAAPAPVELVRPDIDEVTSLTLLGPTGMTAYAGIALVADVAAGDTVVVTGASGGVGSIAAQLAVARGCRVVAITGSPDRARWLEDNTAVDEVIDRSRGPLGPRLADAVPAGYDVCFDNVGGEVLDACLEHGAPHSRVLLCGGISSGYGDPREGRGIHNYVLMTSRRMTMIGFVVGDFAAHFDDGAAELLALERAGAMTTQYEVHHGLEAAPRALERVMSGEARGKQLVRL